MKKYKQSGFAHLLLIAVGALMIGGAATGVASNSARPGDLLYSVDKGLEGFRHMLTFGEAAEAKLHMNQAQERLGELNSLINGNADQDRLNQAARYYGEHIDQALENANKISDDATKQDVLGVVAEKVLIDQDNLLQNGDPQGEQVNASIEAAMQHANRGYEQSFGQLNEAVQAQVMERVQSKVSNMERLFEQVQSQDKFQENQPDDAGEGNKPDDSGNDNSSQAEESNKPEEAGSDNSSNSGQSGN